MMPVFDVHMCCYYLDNIICYVKPYFEGYNHYDISTYRLLLIYELKLLFDPIIVICNTQYNFKSIEIIFTTIPV
jgi:hypothetical protein